MNIRPHIRPASADAERFALTPVVETLVTKTAEAPAAAALTSVDVTRWTARLIDPQCEHDFRVHRFVDDRRRVLLLLGLVALAGAANFAVELYAYYQGASQFVVLILPFMSSWLPIVVLALISRVRTPTALEALMLACICFGMVMRLSMLQFHPSMIAMWPTLMVAFVFVIYLYLPIRLGAAVALALAFSIVAPSWWMLVRGATLPADVYIRGLIWLLMANALGYIAANSLHRSQRIQFAQSLVLQELLSTDAMTGIANRRRFDAALDREWRRCRRMGTPLSLLMIDVDHFKAYNDHRGHPQGDACLRQVARLMVEAAGRPGDLVARYGGEEFVCLLPDIGMTGALAVANKLNAALREADIYHPRSPAGPRLTVSIGAATMKKLAGRPEALVAFADKLLYEAKAAGRNQVIVGQLGASGAAVRSA